MPICRFALSDTVSDTVGVLAFLVGSEVLFASARTVVTDVSSVSQKSDVERLQMVLLPVNIGHAFGPTALAGVASEDGYSVFPLENRSPSYHFGHGLKFKQLLPSRFRQDCG